MEQHAGQRNFQYSARLLERFPTLLPVGPGVHVQQRDLGCRWDGFFEDLQVFPVNFVPRDHRDAGNVAGWARQIRHKFGYNAGGDDRYCAGHCGDGLQY